MTPDQLRLEETHAWLDRAHRDLHAATLLIAGDAHAEALFHCQQAVEKALKAFLTFHQKPFLKTHDLGGLTRDCYELDPSLKSVLAHTKGLTQYAWRFRYPGATYEPDKAEAAEVLQKAESAVRAIERALGLMPTHSELSSRKS